MKKFLVLLFLLFSSLSVIAKEQLTVEQRIQNSCQKKINQYNNSPTIDNEIIVTECIYDYSKIYKLDVMQLEKDLFYLYANKYQNSAENPQYLNNMHKYGMAALRSGSKDISITTLMVYESIIKQDIKDLDYSYELLCNIAPKKAEEIKADIVKARKLLVEQNELKLKQTQQGWNNLFNALAGTYPSNNTVSYRNSTVAYSNTKTWITENHNGKAILTPEFVIIISDIDVVTTCLWLPFENVLINDNYIINLSNGEKAEIKSINYR